MPQDFLLITEHTAAVVNCLGNVTASVRKTQGRRGSQEHGENKTSCVSDPVQRCNVVARPWEMSQSPGLLQMLYFNERSAGNKVKTSAVHRANSEAVRRR